jgi:hypothetical protein
MATPRSVRLYERFQKLDIPDRRTWDKLPATLSKFLLPAEGFCEQTRILQLMDVEMVEQPAGFGPLVRVCFVRTVQRTDLEDTHCTSVLAYGIGPQARWKGDTEGQITLLRNVIQDGRHVELLGRDYAAAAAFCSQVQYNQILLHTPIDPVREASAIAMVWQLPA